MKKKVILVIDDQESILEIIASQLESLGFSVLTTTDPGQLDKIFHDNLVDAVVCDYKMPKMGGVETIKKIRMLRGKSIPIVMISGMIGLKRDDLMAQGANEFLEKPIELEKIKSVLDQQLNPIQLFNPDDFMSIELKSTARSQSMESIVIELSLIEFDAAEFLFEAKSGSGLIDVSYQFDIYCKERDIIIDFSFIGKLSAIEIQEGGLELWVVEVSLLNNSDFHKLETLYIDRQNNAGAFMRQARGY